MLEFAAGARQGQAFLELEQRFAACLAQLERHWRDLMQIHSVWDADDVNFTLDDMAQLTGRLKALAEALAPVAETVARESASL